ncbi:MFS transporter [Nocardioides sp. CER19]|uniref:MFS transporter n=1 Tax=Nocardioides sp. CER19 TaxID=3038538 RepID=UPI00244D4548|nr:MFS transporter [Nocardioides sp. CER19]MDH2413858.1 MFS transporter [Nocardioides sp. CER19]
MSTTITPLTAVTPTAVTAPIGSRHHSRGFWLVAFLFAATMAFAGAPAPLYVLYAKEDGFGSLAVTVIFAAYAVGVAVSLYLAGHLSDRFGRRQVLAPAVLLNLLAALLFLTWHQLGWLLAARFTSGLGIGILTATATAHLTELHRTARPDASPHRAAVVGTAANIGGIGLGPLVAGFLAEYAGRPLYTPYAVFAFLMLAGLLALVLVPETVEPAIAEWRYRPQRVAVPPQARAGFVAAAMLAFVSFAMFGFFTSLAPSFLSGTLHHTSHALAGAITFSVFGSAAATQVLTARWAPSRLYAVGLVVLPVGLVLVVAAILAASLAMIAIAGVVVGVGAGTAFKAAVTSVIELAPPAARGETLAGLFLVSYVGMSLPVVLLGLLLQWAAIDPSIVAFGALMLVLLTLAAVLVRTSRPRRRDRVTGLMSR